MASQNTVDRSLHQIIEDIFTDAEEIRVVNPSSETIAELVDVLDRVEVSSPVQVLAADDPLKEVMDDFLIASVAADLIETGILTVRILDDPPVHSLVITEDRVVSIVTADDQSAGLGTDDSQFVRASTEYFENNWETASEFTLRTPPLSRVRSSLATELGEATVADFEAVLESLEAARGNGNGLDEVTISLLVAAKNEQLLYDISKWGEDVGLASKATFSRTKTQLEDRGLIDTEKVPIDVGRPRLRLLLGTEELEEADSSELAAVAMKHLN
ncbi:MAG: transcriptional regulator TbsP [archaeon]